ncbi:MAG: trimethylamine methyltransferase family protein [Anaerolineae bacterium]
MEKRTDGIRLFTDDELQRLHEASLSLLADPGMRIMAPSLLDALEQRGAQVDRGSQVVRFPRAIVEQALADMQAEVKSGRKLNILNGVVCSKSEWPLKAKFSGACIEYYDWEHKQSRPPARADLIELVRLGEALPDVATVGNPVVYLQEDDGTPIDPRLQRVKTAALIAQYTTKAGPTEVWNTDELPFLMELGIVARGSKEAYLANPCFVTAKETIAPLILDRDAGEVLLALASERLPATIIPMPITGASSPISLPANIAIANAEILGTMTAVRAACPYALVGGGVISGVMDMGSGQAMFAAPEAILQDVGLAELHEYRYGLDCGVGGYNDAKYPGVQSAMEKLGRFWMIARTGRVDFPVGLVNYGKAFSPEQALLDLEIGHYIEALTRGVSVSDDSLCLDMIRQVGIGGHFMAEEHTLLNMRRGVWYPALMDRTASQGPGRDRELDPLERAAQRKRDILARAGYEIDAEGAREIAHIVERAQQALAG